MIIVYAILALLGTVLPLSQFVPWFAEHGLNIELFFQQAFQPDIAAFAWLDVMISAVVLLIFISREGRKSGMKNLWLPALGTCTVGVSLGLPLFLMIREIKLGQSH